MRKSVTILMLALFLFLSACSGNRQYIMSEKEINKIPAIDEIVEYNNTIPWAKIHPVLLMSEGAGLRHDLFLEDGRSFIGIKTIRNNENVLMIIVPDAGADFFEIKGVISSRSGRNFYTVDGKNIFSKNGYLVPKLDWSKIKPLDQTEIEIWHDISDPNRKQIVNNVLVNIVGKNLDQQNIPGLFDRVMSNVARITTDDIILAGVTDFSSLFGIFGIRIWSLVEAVIQKADLSLPYYDTALVDRFQLGLTLDSFQKKLGNITSDQKTVFQEYWLEMQDYLQKKEQYERDYQEWLRMKQK